MKTIKVLKYVSLVSGILVTFFLMMVFGFMMIADLIKEGPKHLIEISKSLFNWYDDPTGFVFAYFIGYAIIWWKPLWGSITIIFGSILFVSINGLDGPPIFAIPTFLVGFFYFIYSIIFIKNKTIHHPN